jgi:hypothetical protein
LRHVLIFLPGIGVTQQNREKLAASSSDMTDWDRMHAPTSVPILNVAVEMNPRSVHVDTCALPASISPVLVVSAAAST